MEAKRKALQEQEEAEKKKKKVLNFYFYLILYIKKYCVIKTGIGRRIKKKIRRRINTINEFK